MLNMEFKYNLNRMLIVILEYITRIYHKYQSWVTFCGKYRTPVAVNARLTKTLCSSTIAETDFTNHAPYRELVGALPWSSRWRLQSIGGLSFTVIKE